MFGEWNSGIALGFPMYQSASPLRAWATFQNVLVPIGATITTAQLKFYGNYGSSSGNVNARWLCNDVDNAVSPVDPAGADALDLTTAYVDQEPMPTWSEDQFLSGPEIKTVIQEIIDRAGWQRGNNITVLIRDSDLISDAYATRRIQDYANVGHELVLHIEWTGGIGPEIIPAPPLTAHSQLSALLAVINILRPDAFSSQSAITAVPLLFLNTNYQVSYECVFAFGGNELKIPIESFQGTFRSAAPSYLSVVIPGLAYETMLAAAVAAPPCTMTVYMVKTYVTGRRIRFPLQTVDLDIQSLRVDEGATNQSLTVSGYRLSETRDPKVVILAGQVQKSIRVTKSDAKYSYACCPDYNVRAGDTVSINGESFVAENISWMISPAKESMTVAQA
jgi:hypothetical protein